MTSSSWIEPQAIFLSHCQRTIHLMDEYLNGFHCIFYCFSRIKHINTRQYPRRDVNFVFNIKQWEKFLRVRILRRVSFHDYYQFFQLNLMSCFNKLCSQNSPSDCSKNGENGFVLIMLSMKKLILLKAKILPWILVCWIYDNTTEHAWKRFTAVYAL